MKRLLAVALVLGLAIFLFKINRGFDAVTPQASAAGEWEDAAEYEKLLRLREHLAPDSPEGLRAAEQIHKIERRRAGYLKAEKPDEFARILHEMRIPYGETEPAYPMNYKLIELHKARQNKKTASAPLPWTERGPGNVSGRARGLIVDPTDPTSNTWFVGSVGGGIWKTSDGGATWIDLAPDLPNLAVSTLAMAPSNPDIIYAGTGESMFSVDVINGDGILKSIDHGQTWAQLPATINNPKFNNIARIIVDPQNPDIVLAATTAGRYKLAFSNTSNIFKSTDGGQTWAEVYNETEIGSLGRVKKVLHIIDTPGNFNIQYAGIDEKGIIKSTDAGDTWFFSSNGINDLTGRFELAIAPSNPDKIYAAAEGTPTSNLYVSGDAGANWIRTVENGNEPNWLAAQGWYDNTITVHPTDENVVYVGGVRLYQINVLPNNTRNTTQLSTGPVHVDHHNLVIIPKPGGSFRILNANDGGIGVSGDQAGDWSKPTDGMNTSQFYGVDKKPGASAYIGGMQDNGTWRSPEGTGALDPWIFQIGGDGYETSWHFNDPLKIIGGSQYNGLRRSLNGGQSWSNATSGLSNTGSSSAPFITKIAKSNQEPDLLFAVGSSGVWKSTNFGGSWSLRAITGTNWGPVSTFLDVKISRANPAIVWAGSRMDAGGKINVSTDMGETFTPAVNYGLVEMGGISGLSTHPREDSTAYVLFSFAQKPKVLRTTDLGQTWEDISGFGTGTVSANGFPDVAIYDLLVLPHTPDTIWAGTEIGLFESTDNGNSWHIADNGLPAAPIWAMTHVEEEVVLATHGRGIWSVHIPGLSSGETYSPLIKNLYQDVNGALAIVVGLRSLYDSTTVKIDGMNVFQMGANPAIQDTLVSYPVVQAGTAAVAVSAFKDGIEYQSAIQSINLVLYSPAQAAYANNFNSPGNDFTGSGFSIQNQAGFSDAAIHTAHPHANNLNITYTLTIPIIVAASDAYFAYDDVALVEPGDPGTVYGNTNFWDYVVVEGSADGFTWVPLEDGYDARFDPDWLNAYNTGTPGSAALYRHHEINMLNTFSPGQQVLLRFRLYADAFVTGWGWAIDNLEIQERIVGIGEDYRLPQAFALEQNYPNPFNPATYIKYQLPKDAKVVLKIYNVLGQEIKTLVDARQPAGIYSIAWDGKNNAGRSVASGLYIYRMEAADFVHQRKMMLLR